MDCKHRIRAAHTADSQDLIKNLSSYSCTKTGLVQYDLDVSRLTATRYPDALAAEGFMQAQDRTLQPPHQRALFRILAGEAPPANET